MTERFAAAGVPSDKISFARDTYTFNYPGPPSEFVGDFRAYYGPTMNAFAAAEKNGTRRRTQAELEALFESQNTSASQDATSHSRDVPARDRRSGMRCRLNSERTRRRLKVSMAR